MGLKNIPGVTLCRRKQEREMEESQVESVQENVQPQEAVIASEESESQEIQAQGQQKQQSQAEINWEHARMALQMQKQEIEDLKQKLASQAAPKVEEELDEFAGLDPTDAITVEQAHRLAEKKAKVAAKQIVSEYMREQNLVNDQTRMRAKFDDYDHVIDTYAIPLIKQDPALAHKIQMSRNPAETAYRLGKLADNYQEPIVSKENKQKADKILKNSGRPTSGNAIGSPLKGQVEEVTKMSPQQVWQLSQDYARKA
jgi:hypothetical protein